MLGLFATLNLGARSLAAQQTAVEITGQNIANVNNPAYARQRVQFQTSPTVSSAVGPQGTGVNVVSIQQLRNAFVDGQVQNEVSVGGYWNAQQSALQYAQTNLGEFLNGQSQGLDGSAATGTGSTQSLADQLGGLFNAFQSVATSPASLTNRQALLSQAQSLASRFNQTSSQLSSLHDALNSSINDDVSSANKLLSDIADLNREISSSEATSGGTANDLRDLRQSKLEELSKLANIQTTTDANGSLDVSVGGTVMVSDRNVLDTLQTYDAGGGQLLIRSATGGTPLTLTGGSIQGTIDARDGALANLQSGLNTLASQLITQVNNVHRNGFSLTGTTGADFFTGTDAASIGVNASLASDPSLVQAAGVAGAPGDNSVALTLAQLADQPNAALGNKTFSDAYSQIVGGLGQSLNDANTQSDNSQAINNMLLQQRASVSGVSIDEEMSNLISFQKAYAASARLISTLDTMLDTVINMKVA